jgi:hypothetical protein
MRHHNKKAISARRKALHPRQQSLLGYHRHRHQVSPCQPSKFNDTDTWPMAPLADRCLHSGLRINLLPAPDVTETWNRTWKYGITNTITLLQPATVESRVG